MALAVLLAARTIRTILYPIRAVTESVVAIGAGTWINLFPSHRRMNWDNWPAPSIPWLANFAITASRTRRN